MERIFLALGAGLAGLAVAIGAFGAHGLRATLSAQDLATFETGVRYQMYHALALLAVAWAPTLARPGGDGGGLVVRRRHPDLQGSLYVLVLAGQRWLGAVTPSGASRSSSGWICSLGRPQRMTSGMTGPIGEAGARPRRPADRRPDRRGHFGRIGRAHVPGATGPLAFPPARGPRDPRGVPARSGLVWAWYQWRRGLVAGASPTPATSPRELRVAHGSVTLVTQNVDGLHHRAALAAAGPDVSPAPARPSSSTDRCCATAAPVRPKRFDATPSRTPPKRRATPSRRSRCPDCDGLLRPDVVWFGEALDGPRLWRTRSTAASVADVCLVVGTSSWSTLRGHPPGGPRRGPTGRRGEPRGHPAHPARDTPSTGPPGASCRAARDLTPLRARIPEPWRRPGPSQPSIRALRAARELGLGRLYPKADHWLRPSRMLRNVSSASSSRPSTRCQAPIP
jgi:uncharacterized membrane protein YgdD (TMEM256/DUF423 family)